MGSSAPAGAHWVPGRHRLPSARARAQLDEMLAPARARGRCLPTRLRRSDPRREGEGQRRREGGGQGTARKPLTKQPWEGREASASFLHRSAMLPVIVHRWRWPMTWREGARVGGRARGSPSVGLVRGKGFSCHLRRRGKRNRGGEEPTPPEKKKEKLYLRHVVWPRRRVPDSWRRRELLYERKKKNPNVIPSCGCWRC